MKLDVAVVGAGPAGAWAAARLAAAGLRTALIDRRERDACGARWLNGVPRWMYTAADLTPPAPGSAECVGDGEEPFVLVPPLAAPRVRLKRTGVLEVDMRHLGSRLIDMFESADGIALFGRGVRRVELDGDRVSRLYLDDGSSVAASLVVDASGLAAIVRRSSALDRWCPSVDPRDLCSAAQYVHEISDPPAARRWCERNDTTPGEALSYVGRDGGYSLLKVHVAHDVGTVSFLTGSIVADGHPSGTTILNRFIESRPWVGPALFGGSRAIPLRRPYAHLVGPGVALLGDAACQVFSTHGSGIGIGLVAARQLADAVVEAANRDEDIGEPDAIWSYPRNFHGDWAGLLGISDAFRRFSQKLDQEQSRALFASGLMSRATIADGLLQQRPEITPGQAAGIAFGTIRSPRSVRRLLPVVARAPAIETLARAFPAAPDKRTPAVSRWDDLLARAIGV